MSRSVADHNGAAVYVIALGCEFNEGIPHLDAQVRPVRLGYGPYTCTVARADLENWREVNDDA